MLHPMNPFSFECTGEHTFIANQPAYVLNTLEGVVNLSYSERVWADWRRRIRNRQAAVTFRQTSKDQISRVVDELISANVAQRKTYLGYPSDPLVCRGALRSRACSSYGYRGLRSALASILNRVGSSRSRRASTRSARLRSFCARDLLPA